MNNQLLDDSSCWPPLLARRVEEVCNRFEAARKAGQRPRIEVYLAGVDEPDRSILLRELLALELEYSTRQGEEPTPQEFEHLFPQHRELIRQAFDDLLSPTPRAACVTDEARQGRLEKRTTPQSDTPLSATYPTTPELALDGGTPVWPGPEHDPVPPTLPGYEIQGVLGRGGMGIVYLARDRRLDRLVALKMMLPTAEATERSRFRTEAQAVARLQHPHIVQIYEVGEHDGLPYFALEYVEGGNLRDKLADIPLPADQAARLVEVISRAVHFAHQRGIIHRDLKPANILLAPHPKSERHPSEENGALPAPTLESEFRISDFLPKIADFGLAKRLDQDSGQTRTGALVGTPSYMAPEQAGGKNQEIGPATDVYSLGALLYALLTGRPPFQAATVLETLEQVRLQEPVRPTQLQPKVPRDLETICLKCLLKEPRKRYASAEALAEDLRCFLAGEPIRARPTSLRERGLKWVKRRPMAAALAAVVAVASLSLLVGAFLYQEQRTRVAKGDARIAEGELRDLKRVTAVRNEVQELLPQADAAIAREDWPEAKGLLDRALDKVSPEPALTDLAVRIKESQGKVRQRERVRDSVRKFSSLYDETMFHLTPFTGADLPANLEAGRQAALTALALFGATPGQAKPLALGNAITPEEAGLVTAGCYELLLVLAESLAKENPGQSLVILDQANQLGLHTRVYHLRRARYLRLLHDASAADEEKEAVRQKAVGALDHFLIAVDLHRQSMLPAAVRQLEEALRVQPDHFWAHYFLAVCYLQGHQVSDLLIAKLHLDSCLRQKNFEWAHLLRGWARTQLGEFVAADQDFSAALKLKREDRDVHYAVLVNRGFLRTRQAAYFETPIGWPLYHRYFSQAVDSFSEAIRLKPDSYQAYMRLAKVYQRQNNLPAALDQMSKAIDTAQQSVKAERLGSSALVRLYQDRADLHRQRHDLKSALADLDLAVQVEPRGTNSGLLADVHAARGQILHSTKDYAEAVDAYDMALRIREKFPDVYLWRAEAQLELRHFVEAIRSFDGYFQHGGKPRADVYRKRAQARAKLHQYSDTIADYTLALRLEPNADTYANRGWIHVVAGAHPLALKDFEEAIRLDPKNGDAHNGRGLMRAKLALANADLVDADADAREALRLGPENARHLWSAARIYAELVGRIDAGLDQRQNRVLATRFDYQHEALQLIRQALALTDAAERASFWEGKIEKDKTFRPIQSSPGYAQLRTEFARSR
jgi:serine/threonine protein kinase/Tfp pilus assembly protein PilF